MNVVSGEKSYTFYPVIKVQDDHEHTTVQNVISADNQISLNTDNDVDKAHLFLQGTLPDDEFFIRCYDPSKDDGSGTIWENVFFEKS